MVQRFTVQHLLDSRYPANRMPFDLSPDGTLLALGLMAKGWGDERVLGENPEFDQYGVSEEAANCRVGLIDVQSGACTLPFPGVSWGAQWSPDGALLAAYVQHEGMACLGVWERESETVKLWRSVRVRPHFAFEVPRWTPDGRHLVVKVLSDAVQDDKEAGHAAGAVAPGLVEVLSFDPSGDRGAPGGGAYKTVRPYGEVETSFEYEAGCGDLVLVDVATGGHAQRLAVGWHVRSWRISPDGQWLATLKGGWEDNELMAINLESGEERCLASGVRQSYSTAFGWDPASRRIAYGDKERIWVASLAEEATRDISGAETNVLRPADVMVNPAPRWSPDGQWVYYLARGAVWKLAADGSECRRLGLDAVGKRLRFWLQKPEENTLSLDEGALWVTGVDSETAAEGLARLDLESGEAEWIGGTSGRLASASHLSAEWDAASRRLLLATESATQPPCIERWDAGRTAPRPLFYPTPKLGGVEFGPVRPFTWKTLEGETLEGALVLPPGGGEKPLPTVVVLADMDEPQSFGFDAYDVEHPHLLAAQGHAVLYLDLPLAERDPMRHFPGQVLPAVRWGIDQGVVDPQRLGLYGTSWAGYAVLGLLVQTDIFRTAVCSSGMGNLTAHYGKIYYWGWSDYGEEEMGGTPWANRQAYVENSPFFYLDRVKTPLLLVSGADDPVAQPQSEDVFVALRRLGKRVEWRSYKGGGHFSGDWRRASLEDMCGAVLGWFADELGGG